MNMETKKKKKKKKRYSFPENQDNKSSVVYICYTVINVNILMYLLLKV